MPSVLVIDDDPDIRALVRAILQEEGFEVEEAENGVVGSTSTATTRVTSC